MTAIPTRGGTACGPFLFVPPFHVFGHHPFCFCPPFITPYVPFFSSDPTSLPLSTVRKLPSLFFPPTFLFVLPKTPFLVRFPRCPPFVKTRFNSEETPLFWFFSFGGGLGALIPRRLLVLCLRSPLQLFPSFFIIHNTMSLYPVGPPTCH